MELELGLGLGLALPGRRQPVAGGEIVGLLSSSAGACAKKRPLGDAFGAAAKATLPLFVREDGDGGGGGGDRGSGDRHEPSSK